MRRSNVGNSDQSKLAYIPRWMYALIGAVGFSVVHITLPWALSLLTPRFWVGDGSPRKLELARPDLDRCRQCNRNLGAVPANYSCSRKV